jgi:hypothetical protein
MKPKRYYSSNPFAAKYNQGYRNAMNVVRVAAGFFVIGVILGPSIQDYIAGLLP